MLEIYSGIDPVMLQLLNILQYRANHIRKMIFMSLWIILIRMYIKTLEMAHNFCMFFMFDKFGKAELSPLKSLIALPHENDKKDKSLFSNELSKNKRE